jgi:hypothetical protein
MSDVTLQQVAENVKAINTNITNAQNLINALSEAGEDTTKLKQDLNSLIIRKNKWENMLKNRGIS